MSKMVLYKSSKKLQNTTENEVLEMFKVGQKVEVIDSQIFSVDLGSVGEITKIDFEKSVILLAFQVDDRTVKQGIDVLFSGMGLFEYASKFISPVEIDSIVEKAPEVEVVD